MKYPFKTTKERSAIMSKIRGKDTKIEVKLRKALWHLGIRYRKNYKALPGSPDIALTKYHIAIFCDSNFWHGYQWDAKRCKIKSNRDYWIEKIEDNIQRDRDYDEQLIAMGWLPLHFWEHQINKDLEGCIDEILSNLPSCTMKAVIDLPTGSANEYSHGRRTSEMVTKTKEDFL